MIAHVPTPGSRSKASRISGSTQKLCVHHLHMSNFNWSGTPVTVDSIKTDGKAIVKITQLRIIHTTNEYSDKTFVSRRGYPMGDAHLQIKQEIENEQASS